MNNSTKERITIRLDILCKNRLSLIKEQEKIRSLNGTIEHLINLHPKYVELDERYESLKKDHEMMIDILQNILNSKYSLEFSFQQIEELIEK